MALQTSGRIDLSDVSVELGNSGTTYITIGSAEVRDLFGISSGAISLSDGYGVSAQAAYFGSRGIFGYGQDYSDGSFHTTIDYINISSVGNASNFGNVVTGRSVGGAGFGSGRGIFFGGAQGMMGATVTEIEYITVATLGNATVFGDVMQAGGLFKPAVCADGVICVSLGGDAGEQSQISYVTIATTGNAASFGSLSVPRFSSTAFGSGTRGMVAGGSNYPDATAPTNISYITYATPGNSTTFGTLLAYTVEAGSCSDGNRGVVAAPDSAMVYVTIATTGNATSFGNLISPYWQMSGCSDGVKGVFGGTGSSNNGMEYITVATTGNATSFGTLTVDRPGASALSGD